MKIQIGQLYINRTWKYLFPCLKGHGPACTEVINSMFKLAVGIDDTTQKEYKGKSILLMVDSKFLEKEFRKGLAWLKIQDFYITDYVAEASLTSMSRKHIIQVRIPEVYETAYEHFIRNEYSKMYTEEQIVALFTQNIFSPYVGVLQRSKQAFNTFIEEINAMYDTKLKAADFAGDIEYDHPIIPEEEIFNFTTKKRQKSWN